MQLVLHMQGDSCVRKISEAKGNPGKLPKKLSHKGILAYTQEKEDVKGNRTSTVAHES